VPSALLVLGYATGAIDVFDPFTGKNVHRLFGDSRAEPLCACAAPPFARSDQW